MHDTQTLVPAQELAATNKAHYPNESAEYRAARNQLLVEEIELRRRLERVASLRRALPSGGEIPQDFQHPLARGTFQPGTYTVTPQAFSLGTALAQPVTNTLSINDVVISGDVTNNPVPEPSTFALLAGASLLWHRVRRQVHGRS
jgi:hypothetical protein